MNNNVNETLGPSLHHFSPLRLVSSCARSIVELMPLVYGSSLTGMSSSATNLPGNCGMSSPRT